MVYDSSRNLKRPLCCSQSVTFAGYITFSLWIITIISFCWFQSGLADRHLYWFQSCTIWPNFKIPENLPFFLFWRAGMIIVTKMTSAPLPWGWKNICRWFKQEFLSWVMLKPDSSLVLCDPEAKFVSFFTLFSSCSQSQISIRLQNYRQKPHSLNSVQ